MAIKPIVEIGTPSLLEKSKTVTNIHTQEIATLIQDLADTQTHLDGAGIAAPQIGVNLRVLRFGFEHCKRYPERKPVPITMLINPEFEALTTEKEVSMEACLSVPNYRGAVARFTHIRYWGLDISGKRIEREAKGFHARAFQHEIDHLDGILFVHRLEDGEVYPPLKS